MNPKVGDILERMRSLELELEKELESTRQNFRYQLVNRKVQFERDILEQQKKLRASLLKPTV